MKTGEGRFLKDDVSNYKDIYKSPSVTVDIAICTIKNTLQILLIKRKYPPFRDRWALPGGFVDVDARETLEETAHRETMEETGIKEFFCKQSQAYGDPDRDPRKRIITVAFYSLMPWDKLACQEIKAGDDAKVTKWFPMHKLPALAFDHKRIITDVLKVLEKDIWNSSIVFELLPKQFTWSELKRVFEIVLGKKLAPYNFQRKINDRFRLKVISTEKGSIGRPATRLEIVM